MLCLNIQRVKADPFDYVRGMDGSALNNLIMNLINKTVEMQ